MYWDIKHCVSINNFFIVMFYIFLLFDSRLLYKTTFGWAFGSSRHIINTQIINPPGPVLVSTHGKATKSFSVLSFVLGAQKNPHWDGSFEYKQRMFWLRNKAFSFRLGTCSWLKACIKYGIVNLYFKGLSVKISIKWCISSSEDCFYPSIQCRYWWNAATCSISSGPSLYTKSALFAKVPWVKVFRKNPKFRILRLTFHKSAIESQPQNAEY